jgi:hypothetical protein
MADELPIDISREHLLEERALSRAEALAEDAATRERLRSLAAQRAKLQEARADFNREAIARRHARGEIYSAARVAAINAFAPGLAELELDAQRLYGRQTSVDGVLKSHALVHFCNVLMAARLNLAYFPPDILAAARAMQAQEEAFASAWLACIDDPAFSADIRTQQRAALRNLRTSTRAMFLATRPVSAETDDKDGAALGKAWNKLDELATTLGVEPLSNFIAVPGEDDAAGVPVARVAASIDALCGALRSPQHKLPAKKATLACLDRLRATLHALDGTEACAWFEIDL